MAKLDEKLNELTKKLEAKNKQNKEKTKANIEFFKKNKDKFRWIFAVIFILVGFSSFGDSIVGSLFYILLGLFLLPPVSSILNKNEKLKISQNNIAWYSIVIILLISSSNFVSSGKDEKLISSYNADPARVLNEAKKALDEKNLILAEIHIEKYLKVLPNNPDLRNLKAQIDSEKAEAFKQAELTKQQQAKVTTTTSQSELVEVSDPDLMGRCFGFLGMLAAKEGHGKWTKGNISYVQSNKPTFNKILKIDKETKSCPTRYEDIRPCLSDYSDYEKQLYIGYLSGGNNYALAKAEGEFKIELLQFSCEN